jgi:hypothetical protein
MRQYAYDLICRSFGRPISINDEPFIEALAKILVDELETAWGLIANAGMPQGDWERGNSAEWREAAMKWRKERFPKGTTKEVTTIDLIQEMHNKATIYENAGRDFQDRNQTHEMHCAMENARCLRKAANIMDGVACNG